MPNASRTRKLGSYDSCKHGGPLESPIALARGAPVAGTHESQSGRLQRIAVEIHALELWTSARVIAYRRQRDSWQQITYYLLGLSAVTAVGAGISAGMSARTWSIVFAGFSAGASVINASLKLAVQVTKSDNALGVVADLRGRIRAFNTDISELSAPALERRLGQLRDQYQKASQLPQPSERQLKRAIKSIEENERTDLLRTHVIGAFFNPFIGRR